MPEGDAIHRDAEALRARVLGRALTLRCRWPRVVDGLDGRPLTDIQTRGKHLLLGFDEVVLRVHRRMKGYWWHVGARWPREDLALALIHDQGASVCYAAPEVERIDRRALATHPVLSALGPDVLAGDFDPHQAVARCPPELTAGEALLRQQIACGIGNVYRAEVLFLERVPPELPIAQVEQPARLWSRASQVMKRNLVKGRGMRTREAPGSEHWVYRRNRRRCLRCGTRIQAQPLGNPARTVYWCPNCQRRSRPAHS